MIKGYEDMLAVGADIANSMNVITPTVCRVLCIDDSEDDVVLLRRLLRPPEFLIDQVSTLVEANRRIAARAHDLYLVDYSFGMEPGLDLIRRWKKIVLGPMVCWTGMPELCAMDPMWRDDVEIFAKDKLLDGTLGSDLREIVAQYREKRACGPIAKER